MINEQHHVSIDIETFSDVDIKSAGAYKYMRSPKFEILLIAYAIDGGPVRVIDLARGGTPAEIIGMLYDEANVLHAYNASFEYNAINILLTRLGLPEVPISRWRCTMVHGLYCGYPAGLGTIGEALGLPQEKQKLKIGRELIQKFCVPKKPTAKDPNRIRIYPFDEPQKWELFKQYNAQDVEAEREIERRLSKWPLPEREQKLWEDDIMMNKRGVGVDMELVEAAIEIGNAEQQELLQEARDLSGLANPKSVAQLSRWLADELGDDAPENLRKATVAGMLEGDVDSDAARRMLELRQLTSKTSTAKYDAIANAVCEDERVRGISFFYGARTGRWASRLVQTQNLPQNHIEPLEFARQLVKDRDAESLKVCYGSLSNTLSQLIRTALVPAPCYKYAVADFSAIEARTVAWLADQEWVLDAFRSGKDIYCETASQMFGVPVEKHGPNGHLRQRGKVAVLALGYGGGEGALINMGALKMGIPEEDLPEIKRLWREKNDHIVALWRRYETAAFNVLDGKGPQECPHGIIFRNESDPATNQEFMTVELPTGRKLFYAHPFTAPAPRYPDRLSLHYYGIEQQSKKFKPVDTFGGKLTENIVQAVARDCLAEMLLRLQKFPAYHTVFTVHDEIIIEAPFGRREQALQDLLDIMAEPIPWAPGLPLKGAGFTADFYQKD